MSHSLPHRNLNPEVIPIVSAVLDGPNLIVMCCPYCGRMHWHGSACYGHRIAHCADPLPREVYKRGYILQPESDCERWDREDFIEQKIRERIEAGAP
jgi:hypothetical protein